MDVFIDEYSDPLFASKPISSRALLTGYQPEHPNPSHEDNRDNPTQSHIRDRETRSNPQPKEDSRIRPGDNSNKRCVIHSVNSAHSLEECRIFGRMSIDEKRQVVENNHLCFICLGGYFAKNCQSQKTCTYCSKRHSSPLHYGSAIGSRHETPRNPQPTNRWIRPHEQSRPSSRERTSDHTNLPHGQHRTPYQEQDSEHRTPSNRDKVEPACNEFRYQQ